MRGTYARTNEWRAEKSPRRTRACMHGRRWFAPMHAVRTCTLGRPTREALACIARALLRPLPACQVAAMVPDNQRGSASARSMPHASNASTPPMQGRFHGVHAAAPACAGACACVPCGALLGCLPRPAVGTRRRQVRAGTHANKALRVPSRPRHRRKRGAGRSDGAAAPSGRWRLEVLRVRRAVVCLDRRRRRATVLQQHAAENHYRKYTESILKVYRKYIRKYTESISEQRLRRVPSAENQPTTAAAAAAAAAPARRRWTDSERRHTGKRSAYRGKEVGEVGGIYSQSVDGSSNRGRTTASRWVA